MSYIIFYLSALNALSDYTIQIQRIYSNYFMNQSEDNTRQPHPEVVAQTGNPTNGKNQPELNSNQQQADGSTNNFCKKINGLSTKMRILIITLFVLVILLSAILPPAIIITRQKQQKERSQIIIPNQKFSTAVLNLENGEFIHILNSVDNGDGTYNVIQIVDDSLSSYSPQSQLSVKKLEGPNMNQAIYQVSFQLVQLLQSSYATFQMPRSEDEFLKLYNLNSEEFARKSAKIGSQKEIRIYQDDDNKVDQLLGRRGIKIKVDVDIKLRSEGVLDQNTWNLEQQNEAKQQSLEGEQILPKSTSDSPDSLSKYKPGVLPKPFPRRPLRLPWKQESLQSNEADDLNEQQLNEGAQSQLNRQNEEDIEALNKKKQKKEKNKSKGQKNKRKRKPKAQTALKDQLPNDLPVKSWEVLSNQLKLFVEIQYNYEKSKFEVVRFESQEQEKKPQNDQKTQNQTVKKQPNQLQFSDSSDTLIPEQIFDPSSLSSQQTQNILSDIVEAAELLLQNTIETSIQNIRYSQQQLLQQKQKYSANQQQKSSSSSNEALKKCTPITQGVFRCTPEDAEKIVEGFKAEQVNDPKTNLYVSQLQVLRIKEVTDD